MGHAPGANIDCRKAASSLAGLLSTVENHRVPFDRRKPPCSFRPSKPTRSFRQSKSSKAAKNRCAFFERTAGLKPTPGGGNIVTV